MLRIVHLAILPGMLLTTCTALVFADAVRPSDRVAMESKQMYSNRPAGFTVPIPHYGTPMAPRFFVPPTAQFQSMAAVPRVPQPRAAAMAVAPMPVRVPSTPQQVVSPQPTPQVLHAPQAVVPPQLVERTFILREPQPEVNVNDELDTFYARLAKIRLEQRQLDEALALIQRIKSETFRVRTVVSLAEYVSRDRSFQTEADTLFQLALAGLVALDRGEPFQIPLRTDEGVRGDVQQPTAPPVAPPPVVTPPPEPTPAVPVPPDPPVVAPPEISHGAHTPAPRPPLIVEEGAGGNNGRQPPPPPPRGNGVDGGIAVSPPESPPVIPELAPPARTTEDNGPTPQAPPVPTPLVSTPPVLPPLTIPGPPENEVPPPDSSITTPTLAPSVTEPEPLPFVRPAPIITPMDNGNGAERIEVSPRQEAEETQVEEAQRLQPPPAVRQLPRIILEEN